MSAYATLKLEFSPDPLSDTTPAWVDVTRFCMAADWQSGKAKDLDEPTAGVATFLLKSPDRRFEPDYTGGAYYPNIVPLRRFRVTVRDNTSGTSYSQGVYYVTSWEQSYPTRGDYSEVTVTCVDGIGLLSLIALTSFSPADASSIVDVINADAPIAFYRLADLGSKMAAETGPDGTYTGSGVITHGAPAIVPGSQDAATLFGGSVQGGAKIDDPKWFAGVNAFSCELVFQAQSGSGSLLSGPDNGSAAAVFSLGIASGGLDQSYVRTGGSAVSILGSGAQVDGLTHHRCLTWDGGTLRLYEDGVLTAQQGIASVQMDSPAAGGLMRVGVAAGGPVFSAQYAAFYETCLAPDRVAAHASAALSHGFARDTAGGRIATLAANPLWSTAGITASAFNVVPRWATGQKVLDEIKAAVAAEMPWGLFYFDDAGNPQYRGWDESTGSIMAVFGDKPGEVNYQDVLPVYDDEIYNDIRVSRDGGDTLLLSDAASQSAYLQRTLEETSLLTADDEDVDAVGTELLAQFKDARFRFDSITLNGADPAARVQILQREIGDLIRVRRYSKSGAPIDVITTILGKTKSFTADGQLSCVWTLARGFNAADGLWHVGTTGYSELGATTVLA